MNTSMEELDEEMDLDFMEEEETIRCGEGGCRACDAAFHLSCDPILAGNPNARLVAEALFIPRDRADTDLDLHPYGEYEPEMDYDLGGEG